MMTPQQKKAIEEASLKLGYTNPMLSFQHGAEFGFHQRDEEVERLKHYGAEVLKLWKPVADYVRDLDEVKVGDSVSSKALEILKRIKHQDAELDTLKKQVEELKRELDSRPKDWNCQ